MTLGNALKIIFPDSTSKELHKLGIISEHVIYIELTEAEEILLDSGIVDGLVEYPLITNIELDSSSVLRSEILEWLFSMKQEYSYIFRKGSISVNGAHIMRFSQYQELLTGLNPKFESQIFVLNLSNKSIHTDLIFKNCKLYGGLNIEKSLLQNFKIINSIIGLGKNIDYFFNDEIISPSITANEATFNGNLDIIGTRDINFKNNLFIHLWRISFYKCQI